MVRSDLCQQIIIMPRAFLEFVSERALDRGSNELSSHSLLGHRIKAMMEVPEEARGKLYSTINKCLDDGTIWSKVLLRT